MSVGPPSKLFFLDARQVIDHVPKGGYKIWLTVEPLKRINERKRLKALLIPTDDGEHNAVKVQYRAKSQDIQRSAHPDRRKDAAESNDFRPVKTSSTVAPHSR